ncbi:AfsR/SARP family transcriptional regulator [Kibdelosporangium aridum]|uniref:DNA-binding transcriptional activator of the SARP family n=1 Tax=Kibdelosporangium aridum TaxID=2030 RepID=A0A1W2FXM1_KIBAR|nr:AfsR/SARP family transcriptional regulator [Kibdelosporangium aridum]SMD26534.1 DNA-binding transcriptional activator of the SARP family [Kibdelosporangium aridum]
MRFAVLGPLEVVDDGVAVPIRNARLRAALGMLLLNANHVVTTEWLVASWWNDGPPPTARKMVHKTMADVRTMLLRASRDSSETPAVVATERGYVLRVAPELIDLPHFLALARRARTALATGATSQTVGALREALAMSRGPVLADLVDMGVSWPELRAADQQRLATLEILFDAALSRGRHRDVVGDLATLVERDSPTERLIGQCMVALYRSGRQLDALNIYREMRATAVTRHNRELGRGLQQLHQAILNQESSLEWSHGQPAIPGGLHLTGASV